MSKEILKELISLMIEASLMVNMSGEDKKKYVLEELKKHITLNNEIEDFIINTIDILIDVDKGKIIFNKKVRKIFSCFNC